MSTSIIPFDSGKLPASLASMFGDSDKDLLGNSPGGGFPVISIKGKVFHIQRGDERTLITKPGEDDPAASIEVVIIKANPSRSKNFYAGGYVEGSKDKPTCYSNNGVAPERDAQEPQAKSCAACPHNQWGSRITESGGKGRACSDSRRLAIATVDTPADPMLLRVPAASMKALEDFAKILVAKGLKPQNVVTKIGFDYSVAWPALTFKPVGLIGDPTLLTEIKTAAESELAAQIVGTLPVAVTESEANEAVAAPAPAPVVTKPAAPKAAAPKVAAPKADPVEAAVATTKKAAVKIEDAPAADTDSLESKIASMIDNMDFDN